MYRISDQCAGVRQNFFAFCVGRDRSRLRRRHFSHRMARENPEHNFSGSNGCLDVCGVFAQSCAVGLKNARVLRMESSHAVTTCCPGSVRAFIFYFPIHGQSDIIADALSPTNFCSRFIAL